MIDARAWLLWSLTAMVVALATRNPLYLFELLLVAAVVDAWTAPMAARRLPLSPGRFAAIVVMTTGTFNALTTRVGDTVLLRLPEELPLVGGPITLEAFVYGATGGLALAAIFAVFVVFNAATTARDLVRLTPAVFHEAGIVLTVALTFVPQVAVDLTRIREAQALRGHRLRGPRDWLPLFVPLVIGGLERSMGLAEAMAARGYASAGDAARPTWLRGALVVGLALLLGGWLAALFTPEVAALGFGALATGAALIGLVLWRAGRMVRRTTYRTRPWTRTDWLVALGCAISLAATLLPLPFLDQTTLGFNPYPRVLLPRFDPALGLALLGLLAPLLSLESRR